MITITDRESLAHALSLSIDLKLKQLLTDRRDQLGGDFKDIARFIVVQPGDSMMRLERELGWSVFENLSDSRHFGDPEFSPSFEWLALHDGRVFEMVFNLTDDFTHVILIPDSPMQNRALRALCLTYADHEGFAK